MNNRIFFAMVLLVFFCGCKKDDDKIVIRTDMVVIEPFKGVTFEMVFVEGGSFYMGAQATDTNSINYDPDARPDEAPVHKVTLNGYYIATTEVTQRLWRHVKQECEFPAQWGDNFPAYNLSWDDCQSFITKLNRYTGLHFRLPTEAEWEYAAKGGKHSRGYKYAGSNNINDVAWYWQNSGDAVHEVAKKDPNELGIYDMSGNVREWCSDWSDYYTEDDQVNPVGPEWGLYRMARGGSRYNNTQLCRTSYRLCYYSWDEDILTGMRLVLDTAEVDKMLRMQK